MKRKPYYLLLCMLLSACGWRNTAHQDARSAFRGAVAPEITQAILENEVHQFLDWYSNTIDSLVDIQLVDNSGVEDTGCYRINFTNTEAYLGILTASGLFTTDYITDKRDYFRLCDQKMKLERPHDGIPYGLDADLILLNQEYEEDSFDFDSITFKNYTDTEDGAQIDVILSYTLRIDFVIKGDKLLIDRIDVAEEGEPEQAKPL